nr:hypothetical protein [Rhodococcus erythropolis]
MLFAPCTKQHPLQEMLVYSIALSVVAAQILDVLHPVEQFLRDDGFVASGIDFALESDISDVVQIREHSVKELQAYRSFRPAAIASDRQTDVRHRGFNAFERVVACGIQLPRFQDKWCAYWVELNRIDLFPFMFDTNIQVADLRRPVGAAVHGLVKHLRLNVEALQRVLQAVHDVEHAFHSNRVWTLAEVIFYGDEADTKLLELNLNDRSVELVAEGTSAVVGDDVLDVRLFVEISE